MAIPLTDPSRPLDHKHVGVSLPNVSEIWIEPMHFGKRGMIGGGKEERRVLAASVTQGAFFTALLEAFHVADGSTRNTTEEMATYTAIHVQSENRIGLQRRLEDFLRQTHGVRLPTISESADIGGLYGRDFLESSSPPTMFALTSNQAGWFTVHYNSFYRFREFLASLSSELDCVVILVMAQNTSDAYHLAVYRSGEHLRTLEFADGGWKIQEGTPLSFESSMLGRNIAPEDEEPYYVFDAPPVGEYCEHFGLALWPSGWHQHTDGLWMILRAAA